ncbi:MAG: calcium-binding protein [Pseudomonadota bacterium]
MLIAAGALVACAGNPDPPPMDPEQSARMAERLFERLDANGDGSVTFAEIEADRKEAFARLDANGDGVLGASELDALNDRGLAQADVPRRGRNGRVQTDRLYRMDRNRDGRITLNEFDGPQGSLLDRADFNGDGTVERAEFDDMVARLRARRRR